MLNLRLVTLASNQSTVTESSSSGLTISDPNQLAPATPVVLVPLRSLL